MNKYDTEESIIKQQQLIHELQRQAVFGKVDLENTDNLLIVLRILQLEFELWARTFGATHLAVNPLSDDAAVQLSRLGWLLAQAADEPKLKYLTPKSLAAAISKILLQRGELQDLKD